MLLFCILTLVLATFGDALGLCDALIEELGEDNSLIFCDWLTNTTALSPFNNATSDITVLAFNDTGYTSIAGNDIGEEATSVQYYMVKGVHESSSFPNISDVGDGGFRYVVLDTFLDSGRWAGRTGGQKILAQVNYDGELEFYAGSDEIATALKTDIPFDGGLIHIIRNNIGPPERARDVFTNNRDNLGNVLVEALYLTGMMNEIEAAKDVTIFAPTDEAFYNVGSIFDGMTMDELKDILGYHIVVGNVTYGATIAPVSLNWSSSQTTFSGKTLELTHPQKIGSEEFYSVLRADGCYTSLLDYIIQNGNIISTDFVLNPSKTTGSNETRFPNAKYVTAGQPLFGNIKASNGSTSTSGNSTLSPSNQGNNQGLSTGARAGVGAGVAIGAVAGLSLGWLFFVRRKRRKAAKETHQRAKDVESDDNINEKVAAGFKAELAPEGSNPRAELHGENVGPPELPEGEGGRVRMELYGDAMRSELPLPPVELDGATVVPKFWGDRASR